MRHFRRRLIRQPSDRRHRRILVYGLLLVLSVVWISLQGGLLPYLSFYTVLMVPVGSGIYLFYVCKALRFYQGPSVHLTTRGEGFSFPIILENTGPLPIVSLRLVMEKERCRTSRFDDSQSWSLNPGQRLEFTPDLFCLYAGAYSVGAKNFVIRDCFGLFAYTGRIPTPWRAVVRPPITNLADVFLDMEHIRSTMELPRIDPAESTPGPEFREYQKGDSLRRVHWKNSARSGRLLVRKPEPRQMERVCLLLLPAPMTEQLEDAKRRDLYLELIVSAADYFCRQNQSVMFYYPRNGFQEMVVDSYENFQDFYERIADVLSEADPDSGDWESWLAAQVNDEDCMILLLNEHFVEKQPITLYTASESTQRFRR